MPEPRRRLKVHNCRQRFRMNAGRSPAEQRTLSGGDVRPRTEKPLTGAADRRGGWLGALFLQTIYSIRESLAPIPNQPAAAWALEDICQDSVHLRIRTDPPAIFTVFLGMNRSASWPAHLRRWAMSLAALSPACPRASVIASARFSTPRSLRAHHGGRG